jgi:hypothetical protein
VDTAAGLSNYLHGLTAEATGRPTVVTQLGLLQHWNRKAYPMSFCFPAGSRSSRDVSATGCTCRDPLLILKRACPLLHQRHRLIPRSQLSLLAVRISSRLRQCFRVPSSWTMGMMGTMGLHCPQHCPQGPHLDQDSHREGRLVLLPSPNLPQLTNWRNSPLDCNSRSGSEVGDLCLSATCSLFRIGS